MIIKVCGISRGEDLISVSRLPVNYAGFVFDAASPRFAEPGIDPDLVALLGRSAPSMKKAGVFTNGDEIDIREKILRFQLDAIQLNRETSPEFCASFAGETAVIKTFTIHGPESFSATFAYEGSCKYFLFEVANGLTGTTDPFDWSVLNEYIGSTPFLLEGFGPGDLKNIYDIRHSQFAGIDIDTRFEMFPGKKDIPSLTGFITSLKAISQELPRF